MAVGIAGGLGKGSTKQMARRNPQLKLGVAQGDRLKDHLLKEYRGGFGGSLSTKRKCREHARPLVARQTMHLVLKSRLAKGKWSMLRGQNPARIKNTVRKHAAKFGVRVISMANVGNHLHFQIQLSKRHLYTPFIRALTASIAHVITGAGKGVSKESLGIKKFWDYRPYTKVVQHFRYHLRLRDYLAINQLEGEGHSRAEARWLIKSVGAPSG